MVYFIVIPKNRSLRNYVEVTLKDYKTKDKEILEARGEDIPLVVERLSSGNKEVIGMTGYDLFKEYKLKKYNSKIEILKRIVWKDKKALFGKPVLCLLGPKDNNLEDFPKKLRICINSKYKNISKKYLNLLEEKGYLFEKIYISGSTETVYNGISDLIIDIVYTGSSINNANLKIYDKIIESDFVILGNNDQKCIEPRKAVIEMDEYNPPTSGRENYIRLDFNENTIGCSPKVMETLKKIKQGNLSVYPEYGKFRKKLAEFLKVKFDQVMLTNATDEAIKTVIETYVEKGKDEILIPVSTFAMFKFYAQLNEAVIKEVLYNDDLTFPTKKVLEEINPKTKIVVLVNPNSPTGTSIPKEDIVKIIEKARDNNALVLIDEAYYPFLSESSIDLIDKFDNLIVSQTFSKAFGMANLRLGYLISNKENIKNMLKVISPYSVNGIATTCAFTALDDYEYVKSYVKEISKNKVRLYNELDKLKIKYYKSDANFLLVDVGDKCNEFCENLKQKGILVRNRTKDPLLKGCIRITIGTTEQTDFLIKALNDIDYNEKTLLIFDIDGVLVDVSNSYRQAIKQTAEFFTKTRVTLPEIQKYKNKGGYNNDWDLTEAIVKLKNKKINKEQIIKKFQELYLGKLMKNEKWILDKEILKKLSKDYELAIMTGRPRQEAIYALKYNGVFNYFSEIIAMEDVVKQKPDPDGLLKILKKFATSNAFYFGDSIDDMEAAVNAKIAPIGILPPSDKSGKLKNLLLKKGAKTVLDNINQIKEVLEN